MNRRMTIAVASGKGGTGKTTVAVGLAEARTADAENSDEAVVRLLDCDVEEPNDHLFLAAEEIDRRPFSMMVPKIDEQKCTACGECVQFCAFNALAMIGNTVMVFDNLCHGCGGCTLVCAEGAIAEGRRPVGEIVEGKTPASACSKGIETYYGILDVGEALAPPIIREVKAVGGVPDQHNAADNTAPSPDTRTIVVDSPPGTSCPMVAAVTGADFALLVTENTPFGLHDLEPTVETISEMEIPMGVVINRCDVGHADVEAFCRSKGIPVLLSIPYNETIAAGYARGTSIVRSAPEYTERFRELHRAIEEILQERGRA